MAHIDEVLKPAWIEENVVNAYCKINPHISIKDMTREPDIIKMTTWKMKENKFTLFDLFCTYGINWDFPSRNPFYLMTTFLIIIVRWWVPI